MKKVIFYLLLALNFLIPLAVISNTIDGDLGWHLRFGQELHKGIFPFLDTYTYSKYGTPWTNHEWGGDWLFWLIYSKIGYWWLNIITSLSITFSFLIIGKTFFKKNTSVFLFSALICQLAIIHIYVARLAMFTPLFAAITFFIIEKSKNNQRWIYGIPPLFWIWSVLHGSWILGFIILNLYLISSIITNFIPKKYYNYFLDDTIPNKIIYRIILVQILSAIIVIINPYGFKIWQEIIQYFGQNYYKLHTTEWLPSYTFPIFWKILITQTVCLVLVVYGVIKKKIGVTHTIIFLAFYYTAICYKRQAIFIGLLSSVVLASTFEIIKPELLKLWWVKNQNIKKFTYLFLLIILILFSFYNIKNIYFTKNVWTDKYLSEKNSFPFESVNWLKNRDAKPVRIFNSFGWGAYLNWTMSNDFVYFDGRGTATWMFDKNKTMLEHYYEILDNQNGLKEIENDQVKYILLRQTNFIPISKPDMVNDWMFGPQAAAFSYSEKTQLEKDLNSSNNWKKVYSDYQANIWQNLNLEPK